MSQAKACTILCVDDEEMIVKSLERTLRLEGYRVISTLSGPEGLEVLEKEEIDLIIADQRMPEMTGSEFLRIVKEKYPNIIRIMLSGYSDFNGLVNAINEGEIFRFLSKPWNDNELKEIIHLALEQKRVLVVVENLVKEVKQIATIARNVVVETTHDPSRIYLRIEEKGIPSEEVIFKFLNFLFDSLGINKEENLRMISGAISHQQGKIVIAIDIGKGVTLQIDFPRAKGDVGA